MDTNLLHMLKVSEMVNPSRSPGSARSSGMGSLGAAAPVFLDASGTPITSIESGQPYGFNVPGYPAVWLILNKDGQQVYNAQFALPMALHQAQDSEIGTWQAIAYDVNTGQLIGSVTFTITAAGTGTGTEGIGGFLSNLSTTQKVVGGLALVLLISKIRKGKR